MYKNLVGVFCRTEACTTCPSVNDNLTNDSGRFCVCKNYGDPIDFSQSHFYKLNIHVRSKDKIKKEGTVETKSLKHFLLSFG